VENTKTMMIEPTTTTELLIHFYLESEEVI
jgi:hypothetical protein